MSSGPTGQGAIRMKECLPLLLPVVTEHVLPNTTLPCLRERELTNREVMLCGVVFENVGGGGGWTAGHLGLWSWGRDSERCGCTTHA